MSKRLRHNRRGVGVKHGRLYLSFTWRGVRCKEYVNDPDTPEHRKKWEAHLKVIKAEIKAGRFEYKTWFPNGTKLGVFCSRMGDRAQTTQLTLRAWLEKWHARRSPFRPDQSLMPEADLHPTTWLHYGSVIKAWFRNPKFHMGNLLLGDVTTSACLDFKRALTDAKLGGKTVLNHMGLLHKALQDAVEEQLIPSNPVPKLASVRRFTRHLRKQSKPLAVEEIQRFLDALPARVDMHDAFVSGQTLRDLYSLWFRAGWRSNEIVALRFDWLSSARQVVELRQGRCPRMGGLEAAPKTGEREVVCDYNPTLFDMFECRRRESLAVGVRDYVFTDSKGRPLSQEWLAKRVWHPTLRMVGISDRGQYNIRDTFITLALSAGEDPGWVAQVCGTSEEMIFRHYRNWMPNLRRGHGRSLMTVLERRSNDGEIGPEIGPKGSPGSRKPLVVKGLRKWRRGESNL